MKENKKLVKQGWRNGMIHQGTISLILTLEDFLVSGPYAIENENVEKLSNNPNIVVIQNSDTLSTYYVLRPLIRGVLYGLNALYQISLYVPCDDEYYLQLYKEVISKIDIGQQFFQDRIYWNLQLLKKDILDRRLACLLIAQNRPLDDWLKPISLETKIFKAKNEEELSENGTLFDLVEIRSFLEEMHQRFFSRIHESKKICFAEMIRTILNQTNKISGSNCSSKKSSDNFISYTTRFNSENTERTNNIKPYKSDRFDVKTTKPPKSNSQKVRKLFFQHSDRKNVSCSDLDWKYLLNEYEDIIKEQIETSRHINEKQSDGTSLTKLLCRWNSITMRKSDVLRMLLKQTDKENFTDKLNDLNSLYYEQKYQFVSSTELHTPNKDDMRLISQTSCSSSCSETNSYLVISSSDPNSNYCSTNTSIASDMPRFTTWYAKAMKT